MHDLYGNEVPIVHYVVAFNHAYGIGALRLGGHDYPRSHDDLIHCAEGIRRTGFRDVAVISWIDANGTIHLVQPPVTESRIDTVPLTDAIGRLACGCFSAQRDHTCVFLD
jgi:hypothetical protein